MRETLGLPEPKVEMVCGPATHVLHLLASADGSAFSRLAALCECTSSVSDGYGTVWSQRTAGVGHIAQISRSLVSLLLAATSGIDGISNGITNRAADRLEALCDQLAHTLCIANEANGWTLPPWPLMASFID
jgi:hypothetical protein